MLLISLSPAEESPTRLQQQAKRAMRRSAEYFCQNLTSHGGYVYFYSLDRSQRWGEGLATKDQIWVQPPGTPTVGMALLDAFKATDDKFFLEAATSAAEALVYGQVR